MVDKLKEFKDDRGVAVPSAGGTLTVDIAGTDANTQNLVHVLDFKVTSAEQAKTVTLEHKGNVLNTWTSTRGSSIDVEMEGTMLVDNSATYDLKITGERYWDALNIWGIGSSATHAKYWSVGEKTSPYAPADTNALEADLKAGSATDRQTAANNDSVVVVWKGVKRVALMDQGTLKIYELDGTFLENPTAQSSCHCLTADSNYLYSMTSTSTTLLYRWDLTTGVKDSVTMDTAITARPDNQGGWFEYFNGHIYSKIQTATSTNKINVSTGAVTNITGGTTSGTYMIGSAVVTTTDPTPKNYIVSAGSSNNVIFNLDTDSFEFTDATNLLGATTFYGNAGFEIWPGIFFCKGSNGNDDLYIDMNGGTPTYDKSTGAERFGDFAVSSQRWSIVNLGQNIESADDMVYDAYAKGVTIT